MRMFAIALLVTNVLFLSWLIVQSKQGESVVDERTLIAERGEHGGLKRLSELPQEQLPPRRGATDLGTTAVEEAAEAETEASANEGGSCYEIEGIASETEQLSLVARLKEGGARVYAQGSKRIKKLSYWVHLPPYSSRQQAQSIANRLERLRVSDFYIVRSGEYANAISLGVFSSQAAAKQRIDSITATERGLSRARIEELQLPAKQYWIGLEWPSEAKAQWGAAIESEGVAVKDVDPCP